MSKKIILIIIACFALKGAALEVQNTAGGLSGIVTNHDITTLKVKGTMDARDFYFIADNLHQLSVIDLGEVAVLPCNIADRHYWKLDFDADELPICSFGAMDITSVVLPQGLKSIGKAAFAGCTRLTSITFPNTLDSIGECAFAGCTSLTSLTLPASVEVVGWGAFMRCTSLTSFKVASSSRLRSIDEAALMDCPSLKTVSLGSTVQSLGERALAGSGIHNVDLTTNRKLNTIGDWAMVKTPVETVKLPSSVTSVGKGIFLYDKDLKEVSLGGKITALNDYLFAGTGLNSEIDLTGVATLGDYVFYNVAELSVVELPETTTWLGTRAMAGMTGLTALTCLAVEVPALGENVWQGVNQRSVPLTVPKNSVNSYRNAPQWRLFLFENSWIKGDVNGDGEVNIADINAVVNIILGHVYDDATMLRADVNEDGEINVADVNAVLSIIMGSKAMMEAQVDTDDQLHTTDLSIRPGEERRLEITLDNASGYSALQCDITLPQGLSLAGTTFAGQHMNDAKGVNAVTTRVVMYSMDGCRFDDDGKAVFSIIVSADASLATESDIVLNNIVLADGDNNGWHAAPCSVRVTNSTGVEDLSARTDRVWVEGRNLCIEVTDDCTCQIVAINGTTRPMSLTAGVNRHPMENGFYVVTLNGKSHKIVIK
ncbi:MAG: leucine-rich repeat protein [Muribaculaceae bacterium]|nr:leucine-rich repeat protein [Muribaculaceae bacterium]